jgi:hypothetical protein
MIDYMLLNPISLSECVNDRLHVALPQYPQVSELMIDYMLLYPNIPK